MLILIVLSDALFNLYQGFPDEDRKSKGSYRAVAKFPRRKKESKKAGKCLTHTASKGIDNASTNNQRDVLRKPIRIWMCYFSCSLQMNQRIFHTSRKGKRSEWSRKKENQHECARRTAWLLHRRAVSPGRDFMHRSLPRLCLFRMLLPALQRCQYDCLHSHTEDQIWLHQTKQKPQSMVVVVFFFFFFSPFLPPPLHFKVRSVPWSGSQKNCKVVLEQLRAWGGNKRYEFIL